MSRKVHFGDSRELRDHFRETPDVMKLERAGAKSEISTLQPSPYRGISQHASFINADEVTSTATLLVTPDFTTYLHCHPGDR